MSMFKKIKGLFVVEDEAEKKVTESKSDEELTQEIKNIEEEATVEIENTTPPVEPSSRNTDVDKAARKKFIDILLKAIDSNNAQGFDYLEFKTALQNLSSMNMDDSTKYQSAMAMAKTMNVSGADIIQSANRYLQILKKEEQKFLEVVQRQKKAKVTDAETAIIKRKQSIEAKKKQILELQKQIEKDTASLDTDKQKIMQEAAKVQATYENFVSAYQAVSGQINKDVANIQKYAK